MFPNYPNYICRVKKFFENQMQHIVATHELGKSNADVHAVFIDVREPLSDTTKNAFQRIFQNADISRRI